jgi:hypothetical protein
MLLNHNHSRVTERLDPNSGCQAMSVGHPFRVWPIQYSSNFAWQLASSHLQIDLPHLKVTFPVSGGKKNSSILKTVDSAAYEPKTRCKRRAIYLPCEDTSRNKGRSEQGRRALQPFQCFLRGVGRFPHRVPK